jgi:aspartate aminotransferase-like enzyme
MNDLTLIGDYWGWYDKRFYHHTGMVSMTYAMREALEVVKVRTLGLLQRRSYLFFLVVCQAQAGCAHAA